VTTTTTTAAAGLNLDAINDVDMLQTARESLLGNEDIMRIISKGDESIRDLLSDPDLAPKTKNVDEIQAAIHRLAAKYSGTAT